jgi:methylamine methyltransferase corrinoid protein reductive activase
MDIGTSGIRAQVIHGATGKTIATVITTHHPLPGANVIDHLHFALEMGIETARNLLVRAVNRVVETFQLDPGEPSRLALCGNPAQMSIFQGEEIRDLAYAGKRMLRPLGISPPPRNGGEFPAARIPELRLPGNCPVIIPPAIRHEVGADALAMIVHSGMLDRPETALAMDVGTNAEMALFHDGRVVTASTAAGPAIEGQHISHGILAVPGAISDLRPEPPLYRQVLLGPDMRPVPGDLVDLCTPGVTGEVGSRRAIGITGTGLIAALDQGLAAGRIVLPRITTPDARLHLGNHLWISESDLMEAGKAVGALRAGWLTLCHKAGIDARDIRTVYLAGASGTYVDASKAARIGMVPPGARKVVHLGNTSLAMARRLAADPAILGPLSALADRLKGTHVMLADSKVFKDVYILELSHWTEGMPISLFRKFLGRHGLSFPRAPQAPPEIVHAATDEFGEIGEEGLKTVTEIGQIVRLSLDGCTACGECMRTCPGAALEILGDPHPPSVIVTHARCNGVSCRRCETACPEKVLRFEDFFTTAPGSRQ